MRKPSEIKLLIVDDDTGYRKSLQTYLQIENYKVDEVASVEDAIKYLDENNCDLILLDVRMEEKDPEIFDISGGMVARKARESGTLCIMITGLPSTEVSRIFLNSRSDEPLAIDVVEKKDGPLALLGAVQAVLNRRKKDHPTQEPDLVVDLEKGLVSLKGNLVKLAQKQYDLLACLAQKEGAVTSHGDVIQAVYGEKLTEQQAKNDPRLERLVERVRGKIEGDPANPRYLRTEKGRGYRLTMDGTESSQDSHE